MTLRKTGVHGCSTALERVNGSLISSARLRFGFKMTTFNGRPGHVVIYNNQGTGPMEVQQEQREMTRRDMSTLAESRLRDLIE